MALDMKNKKTGTNLTDIANQLGLSTCTVSLALRNSTRISQATRQRVFKKAEDLKYFPNLQARSLRTQTTRRIGVILPELDNPFFVEKLGTMHDIARDNDYELTFACSYWDDEKERKAVEHFLIQRADALIISALSTSESLEHLHPFVGSGRPVAGLVGRAGGQCRRYFRYHNLGGLSDWPIKLPNRAIRFGV